MKSLHVKPLGKFEATLPNVASDKSISHRAALFSLLSNKPSYIKNYLQAEDTLSMLHIVEQLGAKIERDGDSVTITPPEKIKEPKDVLDCGNAGTAMRLLIGFLSSVDGFFVLHGDKYLASRPMKRVINPLREVGACIDGREDGNLSPISIRGKALKSFQFDSLILSAQIKSAMILAALNSNQKCEYKEIQLSRDHSERMLKGMGVNIETKNDTITVFPQNVPLKPLDITIPSDPSSGFFFAVAVALIPNSSIILKNILLNKTRIEAFKVLKKMGLHVEFIQKESIYDDVGDILIKNAPLKAVEVSENIPWLIDEIPALSIAFACANGKSVVKNAKELRVKECDRIDAIVKNLRKCGIKVEERDDGFEVFGGEIKEAKVDSFGDHRIAMSFIIAGLKCGMEVEDLECIKTSFPNFFDLIEVLREGQK